MEALKYMTILFLFGKYCCEVTVKNITLNSSDTLLQITNIRNKLITVNIMFDAFKNDIPRGFLVESFSVDVFLNDDINFKLLSDRVEFKTIYNNDSTLLKAENSVNIQFIQKHRVTARVVRNVSAFCFLTNQCTLQLSFQTINQTGVECIMGRLTIQVKGKTED